MAEPVSLGELGADELLLEIELAQGGQDSREEDSASQAGAQSQCHPVLSVQTWTKLAPPPSLFLHLGNGHHISPPPGVVLGTLRQDETEKEIYAQRR